MSEKRLPWWKTAVVYQIYPRSFYDSNGDGIGDLKGILEKLDHIKDLGVDVIWLSPFMDSPLADMGYDVRDYFQVHPQYGTMEDFDNLVTAVHERGMKIIMDAPLNHTSDENKWFVESRSSKESPYRNYYIWQDGENGEPPTKWQSNFKGAAWEYDEETDQYYLHLFQKKQPDLNWDYPPVRQEAKDILTVWLDKGIDGWRMDMINLISKDQTFPEGEPVEGSDYTDGSTAYRHGPRIHEFLQELNHDVFQHYDVMTVGEAEAVTPEEAIELTHPERKELQMVFPFDHVEVDDGKEEGDWQKLELPPLKESFVKWHEELSKNGWVAWFWNSHDQARVVSRYGDDGEYRMKSAKMLATCIAFMRGTLFLYQGEEIGMTNAPFDSLEDYPDATTDAKYEEKLNQGWSEQKTMEVAKIKARDHARTPMQWDDSQQAGFTTGTPWMKVNPNFPTVNVMRDKNHPESIYRFYQDLLLVRKALPVVFQGDFQLLWQEDEKLFAYCREDSSQKLFVICNFTDQDYWLTEKEMPVSLTDATVLLTNRIAPRDNLEHLEPFEATVYQWKK